MDDLSYGNGHATLARHADGAAVHLVGDGDEQSSTGHRLEDWPVDAALLNASESVAGGGPAAMASPVDLTSQAADGVPKPADAAAVLAEAQRLKQAIVQEAREQAAYEAGQLREQARLEAAQLREATLEQIRAEARVEAEQLRAAAVAEADRVKAEAEQLREAIVQQAREQAAYEASQRREQARLEAEQVREATLQQIHADAEGERARLREEGLAHVRDESARLREDALAEAEQIKAAIVEHARARAEAEMAKAEAALAEAYGHRDAILAQAAAEGDAVREAARVEAEQLLQAAHESAEAVAEEQKHPNRTGPGDVALLSSSEIAAREFPRVRHGFDPDSVKKWLEIVELSHAILEEELDRARAEWERALEALAVTRIYLTKLPCPDGFDTELERELERAREEWERSLDLLSEVRPQPSESSVRALLVRSAELETHLGRRPLGYSAAQVRRLLDASATQLARLENQVGRLRAENDELRARMLQQVSEPVPQARVGNELPVNGVFVQLTPPLATLDGLAERTP